MGLVAKILCHRQRRMTDMEAGTGRFIHLPKDHDGMIQNASGLHFSIESFGFPIVLTNATKQTNALVLTHHVVDHFRLIDVIEATGNP